MIFPDQNGEKKCGKDKLRKNEELAFPASAFMDGRTSGRRLLQMQLGLNNQRRFLYFVCRYCLFPKEHHNLPFDLRQSRQASSMADFKSKLSRRSFKSYLNFN